MNEAGHVIFEDQQGRQRVDATMIDPGASAYLMGTGPFHRYVEHLKGLQYDTNSIQLTRIQRVFHFGGDHSVTCRWQARVPVFFNHAYGYITGFLIPGETPMLMGRPVLENLGLTINFQKKLMMWDNAPWQEITIGRHGEYLLPLTSDFRPEMLSQPPSFDLVLADSALTDTEEPYTVNLKTYMNVEGVSQDSGHSSGADGSKKVILKDWKRLDNSLNYHERQLQAMVTAELHSGPRPRLIWEIYAGASRVSEIAQSLGCKVEMFGYMRPVGILTLHLTGRPCSTNKPKNFLMKCFLHHVVAYGARCRALQPTQPSDKSAFVKNDNITMMSTFDSRDRSTEDKFLEPDTHTLSNQKKLFRGRHVHSPVCQVFMSTSTNVPMELSARMLTINGAPC